MKLDRDTVDAVAILMDALQLIQQTVPPGESIEDDVACGMLQSAIKHLAYPDRDIYPKRRGQPKTKRRNGRLGNGRASR